MRFSFHCSSQSEMVKGCGVEGCVCVCVGGDVGFVGDRGGDVGFRGGGSHFN